jgi:Flp pilus assembly protein CpaB
MIVAGLVGMVLTLAVLRGDRGGAPVAVAARDIRPGDVITAADVRVERVRAGASMLATIVHGSGSRGLRGQIAVTGIAAHALIPRRAVRPRAARGGLRAMSIPLDPSVAVGGRLAAGDRVDVLDADRGSAAIIVAGAEVLGVDSGRSGGIGQASSSFTLTVAVDAPQSVLVAGAIADGHVSVTRTTGATRATVGRPAGRDAATSTADDPLDASGSAP